MMAHTAAKRREDAELSESVVGRYRNQKARWTVSTSHQGNGGNLS